MKRKLDLRTARDILKSIQNFFNANQVATIYGGTKYIDDRPLTLEGLKKISNELEVVLKMYEEERQHKLYFDTLTTKHNFDIILMLAEKNGWKEVKSLNFSDDNFEKNVQYVFDYIKG